MFRFSMLGSILMLVPPTPAADAKTISRSMERISTVGSSRTRRRASGR